MPSDGSPTPWPVLERTRLSWKVGATLLRFSSVFVSTRLLSKRHTRHCTSLNSGCKCICGDTNLRNFLQYSLYIYSSRKYNIAIDSQLSNSYRACVIFPPVFKRMRHLTSVNFELSIDYADTMPPARSPAPWPFPERPSLRWQVGATLLRFSTVFISARLLSKQCNPYRSFGTDSTRF